MDLNPDHSQRESDTVPTVRESLHRYFTDFTSQLGRVPEDAAVVKALLDGLLTNDVVDDRKLLLENTIKWVSSYPKDSPTAGLITTSMLKSLWDNLNHPPLSYMGDTWRYRTADGSHNNILYPELGKSGSYYARSVVPQRAPTAALPDPGDIFDALFARRGPAKEAPAKISSFLLSLPTIIIHDIFRTDDLDHNKVASSSYLDLGPLYGHDQAMQDTVRTFKDGKLKPDTFAEPRILGQPPGVGALLVSFNRFHNYVVEQLAEINEGGRFTGTTLSRDQNLDNAKAEAKRDNDLFQTARLITCGLYISIIVHDYVPVIINLNRVDSTWTLDPRDTRAHEIPLGIGNQVSIEFNLLYRWHATLSNKNEAWANEFMGQIWPGQDPSTITQTQLADGLKKWGHSLDSDPGKWAFGGLKRTANGSFEDAGLVSILTESTEDLAGAFGARNVPTALRAIEILGIKQGRSWGAASLNEVRKFFKLKPHATFLDMNPDPDVAASLEALYHEPDNVELYPGLVCEATKGIEVPGSGLCPGLTVAKAILSDAVALIRGDRFYTIDNSPANLTSWGYNEIQSNPDVGFGTTMYKLLQRAYPGWYKSNSVYAMFPFVIPSENKVILAAKGVEAEYDFSKPAFTPLATPVMSWQGVTSVLKDQASFKVPWGAHVTELIHRDWMLSGDNAWDANQKKVCLHALYDPSEGLNEIADLYDHITTTLLERASVKLRDRYQVDIVRDVIIPSHAIITAHIWGILLKESDEEKGDDLTPFEFHRATAFHSWYTFLDVDPAQTLAIKAKAVKATAALAAAASKACANVQDGSIVETVLSKLGLHKDSSVVPSYGKKLIQRLFDSGMSLDDVIWTIVPTASAQAPIQTQGSTNVLDFYLLPENAEHWAEIQAIASSDTLDALEKLRKYALEGLRLCPAAAGAARIVALPDASIKDGKNTINPAAGSLIFPNFRAAGLDPRVFPDPEQVKLDRPDESYVHFGWGAHMCLGRKIAETSLAVQLRAFGRLKNLTRAPGPLGVLKSKMVHGAFRVYMTEDWSDWTPMPATWKVQYDV